MPSGNRWASIWPARAGQTLRYAGFLLLAVLPGIARSAEANAFETPANRIEPDSREWIELAAGLRSQASVTADFTEERRFSFKKTPTVLHGEVRVSADHGLSLHYLAPAEQIVVIDDQGVMMRSAAGDTPAPADARASASNKALLLALRLDLVSLARDFELYGKRDGATWTLALVPRAPDLRRALGELTVEGDGAAVRRLAFRRSETQRVDIRVEPARSTAPFTAEELHRYFR